MIIRSKSWRRQNDGFGFRKSRVALLTMKMKTWRNRDHRPRAQIVTKSKVLKSIGFTSKTRNPEMVTFWIGHVLTRFRNVFLFLLTISFFRFSYWTVCCLLSTTQLSLATVGLRKLSRAFSQIAKFDGPLQKHCTTWWMKNTNEPVRYIINTCLSDLQQKYISE